MRQKEINEQRYNEVIKERKEIFAEIRNITENAEVELQRIFRKLKENCVAEAVLLGC